MPEEMECDKTLVLWCRHCQNFINQTLTLETIRRWWIRYEEGEETVVPPIGKHALEELLLIQTRLNAVNTGILEKIELHLKDFFGYNYREEGARG